MEKYSIITEEDIIALKNFILQLRNDERFMSYADDSIGIRRNIAEINQYLSRNSIGDAIKYWGLNCNKKYSMIIECYQRYNNIHFGNETGMDTIRKTYPNLLSNIDEGTYEILNRICNDKHNIEDVLSLLRSCRFIKKNNFNLYNVMEHWEPLTVLDMYKSGQLNIEYIKQCFYFNASKYSIQTINYDNDNQDRYIQSIDGNEDIIQYLNIYHNAFMSYNSPNIIDSLPLDILIIESLTGTIYDKLIAYIKNNDQVVSVQDIRMLCKEYDNTNGINSIIRELNTRCIDITYGVKDLPSTLNVGSIVRCSIKGSNNSVSIGYMSFNGIIPDNVRVSKHLMRYCTK